MLEEYGFISKKREKAEVNMGPLLDMVFILLIFFVITAQFTEDTGVTVERPGAPSATLQTSQPIYISLTSSGTIHINGEEVSTQALLTILRIEVENQPEVSALLIGDRRVSLEKTVEVMDICNRAGIKRVSIAAERG